MENIPNTEPFQATPTEGTQPPQNPRKLKGVDIFILFVLSAVPSIVSFFSARGYFYDIERGDSFVSIVSWLILLPATVVFYPLYFLLRSLSGEGDSEGVALGAGILITYLSPIFSFIFWFIIFYLLVRISKRFLISRDNLFFRHVLSIVIVITLASPYLYYSVGSNKVDACLSGQLNSEMMSGTGSDTEGNVVFKPEMFTVGPDSCFDSILEPMIYKENPSSKEAIDFCISLSAAKTVFGTQTSYRDYCMYALGFKLTPSKSSSPDFTTDFHRQYLSQLPLPTYNEKNNEWRATYETKLCDVYGSLTNSDDVKNKCLAYYINYPTYSNNKITQIYCKSIVANFTLPERCSADFSSVRNTVSVEDTNLQGSITDEDYNVKNFQIYTITELMSVYDQMITAYQGSSATKQIQFDKDINDEDFPLQGESHVKAATIPLKLMSFNRDVSLNAATEEALRLGYRTATIRELIAFAWRFYNSSWDITIGSADLSDRSKRAPIVHRVGGVAKIGLASESEYILKRGEWLLVSKE